MERKHVIIAKVFELQIEDVLKIDIDKMLIKTSSSFKFFTSFAFQNHLDYVSKACHSSDHPNFVIDSKK